VASLVALEAVIAIISPPYVYVFLNILAFMIPVVAAVISGSFVQTLAYLGSSTFLLYSFNFGLALMFGIVGLGLAFILLSIWAGFSDPVLISLRWRNVKNGTQGIPSLLTAIPIALVSIVWFHSLIYAVGAIVVSLLSYILGIGSVDGIILTTLSWLGLPMVLNPSASKGGVCVGRAKGVILSSSRGRFWRPRWLPLDMDYCVDLSNSKNYNISVSGSSGSGKSTLLSKISLSLGVSVILIDLHGEHDVPGLSSVSGEKVAINPLSLMGFSPRERALEVSSMVKSLFSLGPLQSMVLTELIMEAYEEKGITEEDTQSWSLSPPTFRDVLRLAMAKRDTTESSLLPYLTFLSSWPFNAQGANLEQLLSLDSTIDLSKLPSDEIRYIVVETMLRSLIAMVYRRGQSPLWKVVIIDEAPFLLSKESGAQLLRRISAEGRKFGVGLVLASQTLRDLKPLLTNSSNVFVFNTVEPEDLSYAAQLLSVGRRNVEEWLRSYLPRLGRGEALAYDQRGNLYILDIDRT
jgi:Predicted ATPase